MFSVIIPTKGRPRFLREAIASAASQTYPDKEIIIVNDGASPIEGLNHLPVRILDNGSRGAVAARRLGIEEARYMNIAFLDDDDYWIDRDHLSKISQLFSAGAQFCFADGILRFEPIAGAAPPADIAFAFDADALSLKKDNTILISSVCYRRSLHDAVGHFDDALPYYWDWDWYLRVTRAGNSLHRLASPSVVIRVHPDNMSGLDTAEFRRANLAKLAEKHGLPELILKNHLSLAQEHFTQP